MQAKRGTCSRWIERRTELALRLARSLRNIPATRTAVNAQPALSITAAESFALRNNTVPRVPKSACRENRCKSYASRTGFRNAFQAFTFPAALDSTPGAEGPVPAKSPSAVNRTRLLVGTALTMIPRVRKTSFGTIERNIVHRGIEAARRFLSAPGYRECWKRFVLCRQGFGQPPSDSFRAHSIQVRTLR
jgi:hypothetical protein